MPNNCEYLRFLSQRSRFICSLMPSLAITDLHLEDLENIKPVQITKLKRIGIESALELATSIPQELAAESGKI
jgi:hypothetical protein